MKKHLINILIGILLGVALVYLTSCRTVQRSRSAADSSSVRTEASAERWAREVVTEYIPTSGGTGGAPLSLPTIEPMPWNALQFVQLPGARVEVPVPVPGPVRVIRQIIRESGEKQATKAEEKKTAVTQSSTERGWSPIQERALLLVSWAVLIAALGFLGLVVGRLIRRA